MTRRAKRRVICIQMAFLLLGSRAAARDEPVSVSMIELIAYPEKFDRKTVSVVGYLTPVEEEHRTAILFLHREDADQWLHSNGVLVIASDDMMRRKEQLYGMYVRIVGVFHATPAVGGQMVTEIKDIKACTVWSDPARPHDRESNDKCPAAQKGNNR
jgi:hypothetical protein